MLKPKISFNGVFCWPSEAKKQNKNVAGTELTTIKYREPSVSVAQMHVNSVLCAFVCQTFDLLQFNPTYNSISSMSVILTSIYAFD